MAEDEKIKCTRCGVDLTGKAHANIFPLGRRNPSPENVGQPVCFDCYGPIGLR